LKTLFADTLSPMPAPLPYNRIAGQSIERLAALSDGIFAVAMTLLVLEIHVPEIAGVHSERDLLRALAPLSPRLLVHLMSFLMLGAVLYASWRYAVRAHLLSEQVTYEMQCAVERRIVVAQVLYAVGFALCVFSTFWSIIAIVLLQLNYAIAPRIPWLKKV